MNQSVRHLIWFTIKYASSRNKQHEWNDIDVALVSFEFISYKLFKCSEINIQYHIFYIKYLK